MSIREEGSNFPRVLGRKNILSTKSWGDGRMIGDLPSVRGIGRSPGLLPQHDISLAGEREVEVHNLMAKQHLPQQMGLLGIKGRLQYRLGKLKGRFLMFSQKWDPGREIGDLPKPMSILSGPEHGQYPLTIEW